MRGIADFGKTHSIKREDDLYINPLQTENNSNCKYEKVQVSLSTPLTSPCAINVL